MPSGIVTKGESVAEIRCALSSKRGIPETGEAPEKVLGEAADLLFEH